MSDTMGLILGICLAVAISVILMKFQKKNRQSAWAGTVMNIRKHEIQRSDDVLDTETEIAVTYRTDDGKKKKLKLSEHAFRTCYSDLKVGDRLIKESGKDMPEKAES